MPDKLQPERSVDELAMWREEGNNMKWIVLVEGNCTDSAREDEFNDWYNLVHLPDMMETPGIVNAVRYENVDPVEGRGKYLAAYEVETDDLQSVFAANREQMEQKRAEGRISELLEVVSVTSFRQAYALSEHILVAGS